MATVTREQLAPLHEKLVVSVSKNDYQPAFEKQLKEMAKTANIPGFRRGNVPAGLLRKLHGQSIFQEQVLRMVQQELSKNLETSGTRIFGEPLPSEGQHPDLKMEDAGDYTFEFEIGVQPELKVDFEGTTFTKYRIQAEETLIDQEVERLQTRYGVLTEQEEINNEENVLNFRVKGNEEGAPQDNSLLVKHFSDAFCTQLMGRKLADEIVIVPATDLNGEGRKALMADLRIEDENTPITFDITRIGMVEKAVVDNELFAKAYPGETIENESAFRARVRKEVEGYFEGQAANQLHDQLYHFLLDHVEVNLPDTFLKRWLKVNRQNPSDEETAEKEYADYSKQLKWSLVNQYLVQKNDIRVTQGELRQVAKMQLLSYMNMPGLDMDADYPWLEDYLTKQLANEEYANRTFFEIQSDKLFTALEAQVKTEEKPISVDDFTAMVKNHKH